MSDTDSFYRKDDNNTMNTSSADNDEDVSTMNMPESRRKRINSIKICIVLGAISLLLISIVLSFVLLYKVLKLEQRLNNVLSLNDYSVTIEQI